MIRNPIIKRLLIFIISVSFFATIGYLSFKIVYDKETKLAFYIGKRDNANLANDYIISTYPDYQNLIKKYSIKDKLTREDLAMHSYVVSFQEFDKCSERSLKDVKKVEYNDSSIEITYQVHNKCGMCKSDIYVYLVPINKIEPDTRKITYKYDFDKTLQCNKVS